jgi:hypothetical protein
MNGVESRSSRFPGNCVSPADQGIDLEIGAGRDRAHVCEISFRRFVFEGDVWHRCVEAVAVTRVRAVGIHRRRLMKLVAPIAAAVAALAAAAPGGTRTPTLSVVRICSGAY